MFRSLQAAALGLLVASATLAESQEVVDAGPIEVHADHADVLIEPGATDDFEGDLLGPDPFCAEPIHGDPSGFRWFARVLGGGFIPPDEQVSDNNNSNASFEFREVITSYDLHGSIELMWQERLDLPAGTQNRLRNWRLGVLLPLVSLDAGRQPRPVSAGPEGELGWFQGYETADYWAAGFVSGAGISEQENDFRSEITNIFHRTRTEQSLFGAQVSVGRVARRARWEYELSGHALIGGAVTEFEQRYASGTGVGEALIDGVPVKQREETDFAARGEIRLRASYYFRENWSVDGLLRGFVQGPWYDAPEQLEFVTGGANLVEPEASTLGGGLLYLGVTHLR